MDGADLLRGLGADALVRLVDGSSLAIALVEDDRWAYLNGAALRLAGRPLRALVGRPTTELRAELGLDLLPTGDRLEVDGRVLQGVLLREHALASRRDVAEAAAQVERQRLARELHDSVTASLFAVHQRAQVVQRALGKDDADLLRVAAADLQALAEQALTEVRAVLGRRRPATGSDLGPRLVELARSVTSRDGLPVEVHVPDALPAVPEDTAEHLHRIAGEALHNAVKHAAARSACLRLALRGSELVLDVSDDGRGFDPAAPRTGGHGQRTMQERASLCGGWLTVDSAAGRGTRVVARVPLPG